MTRRLTTTAALVAAALLAGSSVAWAHAVLEATTPLADAVLPAPPPTVTLTFDEAVALPPSALRVFDPGGVEVDDGRVTHPPGHPDQVRVGLRAGSAQGSYTVAWRVVSADTHPVSGAWTFSVGHPSATSAAIPPPTTGSPLVSTVYWLIRAVGFASFALLVGATAVLLICLPRPTGAVGRRVPGLAVTGWVALVLATIGTLLIQAPYGNGTGLASVLEPGSVASTLALPLGGALAARLLLLVLAAVYLGRLRRWPPAADASGTAWLRCVGGALAVGLAATWAVAGHAATGPEPWLAVPVDVAHLVAMAVWLGGLAALASTPRRAAPADGAATVDDTPPGDIALRFSRVAATCACVLLATGGYQTWRQLGGWAAFAQTGYGRVLLAKIVVVVGLLALAALSRRAVHRPAPGAADTLRRTVRAEAVIAAVVLALTAVLVDAEPGRIVEAARPHPVHRSVDYDTGGPRGRGSLDVSVEPGLVGANTVRLRVRGVGGAITDIPGVRASAWLPDRDLGPLPVVLRREGPGRYAGLVRLTLPGSWQLAVTVRTSDIDQTTVRIPLDISG